MKRAGKRARLSREQALRWLLRSELFVFATAFVFGGLYVLRGDAWTGVWVLLGGFLAPQPFLLWPFRTLLRRRPRR